MLDFGGIDIRNSELTVGESDPKAPWDGHGVDMTTGRIESGGVALDGGWRDEDVFGVVVFFSNP